MALLGDDGRGYELARRLEAGGVWRSWLGDSCYANFVHFLSSPSSWEVFMRADDRKSRAQIHLQLRVRALLFDKASVSLFLRPQSASSSSSSSAAAFSKLNPTYLQLHGDDVYFTLENSSLDGVQQRDGVVASNTALSKGMQIQAKATFSVGSRYGESEIDNISQRFRQEELPESWYSQFIEKYRANRPYKSSLGDRELDKRTPEEMSAYLRHLEKHKRRRLAFKEDQNMGFGNHMLENKSNMNPNSILDGNLVEDDTPFFPETLFAWNCVPDSALPPTNRAENNQKIEFNGVLDTLPQVMTRSPIMIERLGIKPECLGMEQGGIPYHGKNGSEGNRNELGKEQASQMSKKVIARVLTNMGFEGTTEVPMEVLSQLLSCHICKLGRTLKVLADSYRKQCSAIELLKMFLQTAGYSNLGALVEQVKDNTRNTMQQTQQQVHGVQSQLQQQNQSSLGQPQQIPRQMHQQMQQMILPQNLALQQQQHWERMRRRQQQQQQQQQQQSNPRSGMNMDKDRPMVEVKIENPTDLPMDGTAFTNINTRHPQMQIRQQKIAAMSNLQAQSGNQFRHMTSLQMPQIQTQNVSMVRAPPVKVEGFQELMGGDSTLKHDLEENRLTSPSK
ncbi:uncharacterized protein LOC131153570 [Malania oleifera]|uniref:uncharacterized protein LOC131153570 n=1 Tax=Malania oleifera TaxID=397392 RepID=UPI0025ADA3D9|nr:uncharacterized protein LOC131153570 [Malania oleifera]